MQCDTFHKASNIKFLHTIAQIDKTYRRYLFA